MADDFPSEYDAIILGTGLPESVIAAALARVGKSVLHLDRNEYYSSDWATFTFDGLLDWIKSSEILIEGGNVTSDITKASCKDGEKQFLLPGQSNTVKNIVTKSYFRTKTKETTETTLRASPVNSEDISSKTCQDELNENKDGTKSEEESEVTCKDDKDLHQEQGDEHSSTYEPCEKNLNEDSDNEASASEVSDTTTEDSPAGPSTADNELENQSATMTSNESLPIPTITKQHPSKPAANKDMTYEDFEKHFRQFNIDLAPKMLFSRGPLVEAIISANISHYAEFKAVNRILTYLNGNIEDVPCSRSDVFSSKLISAIEKRTLMKFLTFCIDFENHEDEYKEFIDKSFVELLQSRRLSPNLQHFVLHSIAMLPSDANTLAGLQKTRSFLHSLGRYGNTPFIWPLYGIGELPQAFCRMCAVFGGLYCLRRGADSLTVDVTSNTCTGITSEGQFLKCKWLVMGNSYLPSEWQKGTTKYVSRAVFITDKSLKLHEQGSVMLMSMPRSNEKGSPITVIELDKTSAACPNGLNVVHLVTDCCVSAEDDLKSTAETLLHFPQGDEDRDSSKPIVLWSMYFNHGLSCEEDYATKLPGNVYCAMLPGSSLGFTNAMDQAKHIFQSICGSDEEFLPAIPNPEDIIMDDVPAEEQGNHAGLVGGSGIDQDHTPSGDLVEEEASVTSDNGDSSLSQESRHEERNSPPNDGEVNTAASEEESTSN